MYAHSKTLAEMRSTIERNGTRIYRAKKLPGRSTMKWREWGTGIDRIRYHDTDILTFNEDGTVTLNSGGFRTMTTKDRMSEYLPDGFRIWQEKSVWYIGRYTPGGDDGYLPVVYFDGMILPRDYEKSSQNAKREKKRIESNIRKIGSYCQTLAKMETIPVPDSGDCFVCQTGGASCAQSHIDEFYIHGTLVVNALRVAGYSDDCGIPIIYDPRHGPGSAIRAWAVRAVRSYLKKALSIPK